MRAPILAASLIAAALAGGAARADDLDVPGATRGGPTFQRPAAENPDMRAYMTTAPAQPAPAPNGTRPAAPAQPGR